MTIAFDLSMVFGPGGIPRYARELVSHMVAMDLPYEYRIFTRQSKQKEIQKLIGHHKAEILPVLPHTLALGRGLSSITQMILKQRWTKHGDGVDLVHFHEGGRWLPPVKKFVVTIHDLFPIDPEIETDSTVTKTFPKLIQPMVYKSERIIVPSEYVKTTFQTFFPDVVNKISVVPLAASDDFAATQASPPLLKQPYLIWVGRLDQRKNLGRILKAWTLLPSAVTAASRFVVVGPWDHADFGREHLDVKQLIHSKGIELRSHMTHAEHISLLTHARGLVFPSIAEGFGLPVIEAMKCGCPVLTSTTSSLPEVIGNAGISVDPFDVNAIRDGMEELLTNADLRENLRDKGLARASLFSWNQTAKQTADVYSEVLGA